MINALVLPSFPAESIRSYHFLVVYFFFTFTYLSDSALFERLF